MATKLGHIKYADGIVIKLLIEWNKQFSGLAN